MIASDGPSPPRIPTPRRYSKAISATLRLILPLLADGAPWKAKTLAASAGVDEHTVKKALLTARRRRHVVDRGATWLLCASVADVEAAFSSADANENRRGRKPRRTKIKTFYLQTFRPYFASNYCDNYVERMDLVVDDICAWQSHVTIEEMDVAWFQKFEDYNVENGLPKTLRCSRTRNAVRIVRHRFPYKRLPGKPTWRLFEPSLRNEPRGDFGEYYVRAFERTRPRGEWGNFRAAVLRFLLWLERAVRVSEIDEELLQQFLDYLIKDGVSRNPAMAARACIRKIVNHCRPGAIGTLREKGLPQCPAGSLQHFIGSRYIPWLKQKKTKSDSKIQLAVMILHNLHEFVQERPLWWPEFDDQRADDFLQWRQGFGRQQDTVKPSTLHQMRDVLISISKLARADGLTGFRLHPAPIPGYKKSRSLKPPATHPKKPHWDAELGTLSFGGRSVTIASQATAIRPILNAFQQAGWPEWIESPFNARTAESSGRVALSRLHAKQDLLAFQSRYKYARIGWKTEK